MSYTLRNRVGFAAALYAKFHRMEQARNLVAALEKVIFGVVASQRDGINALRVFEEQGFSGDKLFGEESRFPGGIRDVYLAQYMGGLAGILVDIQLTLSFRSTAVAKDVENSKGANQERVSNYTEKNQEYQDNAKAFAELTKRLASMLEDPNELWTQETFEVRMNAVWVAGGGPAPPA